jgi:hypothetical protein
MRIEGWSAVNQESVLVLSVRQLYFERPPTLWALRHLNRCPLIEINREVNRFCLGRVAMEMDGCERIPTRRTAGSCFTIHRFQKSFSFSDCGRRSTWEFTATEGRFRAILAANRFRPLHKASPRAKGRMCCLQNSTSTSSSAWSQSLNAVSLRQPDETQSAYARACVRW